MPKNMIPMFGFDGAMSTLESLVESHRGKGRSYSITASYSIHARYYNDNDDPDNAEECRVGFKICYQIKARSYYVMVNWTPTAILKKNVRDYMTPNWQNLADHDSCWRDADGNIKDWIRSEMTSSKKWDNAFPFISCEEIKIEDTTEAISH